MAKQKAYKMAYKKAPMGMVYVITDCTGCRQGRQNGYTSISSAQGAATRMERKLWAIYDMWNDANMEPRMKWQCKNVVYRIELAPMVDYNPMA